jgi:FkbM family methyltransferase
MQTTLKKLIHRLLCNNITGSIIHFIFRDKIPDLRWRGFKFTLPASSMNKRMVAAVFWGFYESSEIRFIEKYMRTDLNVIELGSSVGIVSSHIASKLGNGRHFIMVEANPFLIEAIQTNIKRHQNTDSTFEIINRAVGYDSEEVMISISNNNTETRVIKNGTSDGSVAVKTVAFGDLVKDNNIGNYILICDIEGSEVEMLLRETDALKNCIQLFIELHSTIYNGKAYSIDVLKNILVDRHGFNIEKEHGPVVYFSRRENRIH